MIQEPVEPIGKGEDACRVDVGDRQQLAPTAVGRALRDAGGQDEHDSHHQRGYLEHSAAVLGDDYGDEHGDARDAEYECVRVAETAPIHGRHDDRDGARPGPPTGEQQRRGERERKERQGERFREELAVPLGHRPRTREREDQPAPEPARPSGPDHASHSEGEESPREDGTPELDSHRCVVVVPGQLDEQRESGSPLLRPRGRAMSSERFAVATYPVVSCQNAQPCPSNCQYRTATNSTYPATPTAVEPLPRETLAPSLRAENI